MENEFKPLTFHALESGTLYFRPRQELPERVKESDSALDVMTDLSQVTLYTAELTTPLPQALQTMVNRGVRMLLVRDADGAVRGLVTSRDIESTKADRILEKTGGSWEDLLVCDIMTLEGKLDALGMEEVRKARVGDIVATLRAAKRQHTMVVDTHPDTGRPAIRGIFSLSQIALQLGLDIDPSEGPTTYAALEQVKQDSE
jgi:hypothetical protein